MRRLIFLWLSLLLVSGFTIAQTTITARLDTARAVVGQVVSLDVKIVQVPGTQVFWPLLNDSIGGVDLINAGVADTQKTSGDQWLITRRYELMAFDSGNFTLPALSFNVRSKQGDSRISTDPLQLQIFYAPVDTTKEIKDIAPIIEVPFNWRNLLLIIAGVLLVGVLIFWLYKKYFRKEKQELVVPGMVKLPHESALEELDQLHSAGLWQQGRIKEYYTELTDILRRYITARWNINAMELTSDEILSAGFMKMLGVPEKSKLEFILQMSDLVKFAKALPLPADHENCLLNAVEFVRSSVPTPEVESKEEVKS